MQRAEGALGEAAEDHGVRLEMLAKEETTGLRQVDGLARRIGRRPAVADKPLELLRLPPGGELLPGAQFASRPVEEGRGQFAMERRAEIPGEAVNDGFFAAGQAVMELLEAGRLKLEMAGRVGVGIKRGALPFLEEAGQPMMRLPRQDAGKGSGEDMSAGPPRCRRVRAWAEHRRARAGASNGRCWLAGGARLPNGGQGNKPGARMRGPVQLGSHQRRPPDQLSESERGLTPCFTEWSQWWGSNPRPTVYETVALPLSYIGA